MSFVLLGVLTLIYVLGILYATRFTYQNDRCFDRPLLGLQSLHNHPVGAAVVNAFLPALFWPLLALGSASWNIIDAKRHAREDAEGEELRSLQRYAELRRREELRMACHDRYEEKQAAQLEKREDRSRRTLVRSRQ